MALPPMSDLDFNPRSPWGERHKSSRGTALTLGFQSTLPVGGATRFSALPFRAYAFQSTLPVGGATKFQTVNLPHTCISIHAPRGGSDCARTSLYNLIWISIHAPRGGSDLAFRVKICIGQFDFNPRSPWGERPAPEDVEAPVCMISIHAPRGGSDFLSASN